MMMPKPMKSTRMMRKMEKSAPLGGSAGSAGWLFADGGWDIGVEVIARGGVWGHAGNGGQLPAGIGDLSRYGALEDQLASGPSSASQARLPERRAVGWARANPISAACGGGRASWCAWRGCR